MKQFAVVNFAPEPGSVELREVDIPEIGKRDVLLEVQAVSLCGSELHQWHGTHGWPVRFPVILGHEYAGTINRIGTGVRGFASGDRVAGETAAIIDPDSPLTRRGLYNLDPARKGFGYGVDGAMRRFMRVPARCLHHVGPEVAIEHAALAEPCSVAYNAVVNNADVRPGDRIVVLGPGPIGILCGIMAQLQGATVAIVGLERDRARLATARQYGMQVAVDEVSQDWIGADGVIDAAGVSNTLQTALEVVRPGGWITKVGWGPEPLGFSLDPLVQKNITLRGSFSHNYPVWESVLGLLSSGKLNVAPLIGGCWPLTAWREAFEAMDSGRIIKAILYP